MEELPTTVSFVRRTEDFTPETVPRGLLRAHRVAKGVWGRIEVTAGTLTFVLEDSDVRQVLGTGDRRVIPPEVAHHVEPSEDARFAIEFFR